VEVRFASTDHIVPGAPASRCYDKVGRRGPLEVSGR
jgi:hypothetical protein